MNPLISICIPAYKNAGYLDILLQSVSVQTFTDFEVVVSDDSPDDEVALLCKKYEQLFTLVYHKNIPSKGSPANWNQGIALATGQWIKMMHDDDWFASAESLAVFANAVRNNPDVEFFFSGYHHFENGKLKATHIESVIVEAKLRKSPLSLFQRNYIGHPSTTLIKNNLAVWYDEKVKWVVDFEFYIRCLAQMKFCMIPEALINIGINEAQITKAVFRQPAVEIPENIYLLNKLGTSVLNNIIVYDYYWRMLRNLGVRSLDIVIKNAGNNTIPAVLTCMLKQQLRIPLKLLRIGALSKSFMLLSYLKNKKQFV